MLCDTMDCSTPGFPVHHQLPEFTKLMSTESVMPSIIHPSHPLSLPFPPVLNLSQHQGLFQWVSSSYQVAKVLELQHQSFQWIFRIDFLEDWLVLSSCYTRDSQESSSAAQFENINSLALCLLFLYYNLLTFMIIKAHWGVKIYRLRKDIYYRK